MNGGKSAVEAAGKARLRLPSGSSSHVARLEEVRKVEK